MTAVESKKEKKNANVVIRVLLLGVLFGLGFWVYQQNVANYETLTGSIAMTENILDRQIALTKDYAQKLALLQDSFQKTETLLSTVQEENRKLNEQIALLSHVTDLQSTVSHLREENSQVMTEIKDLKLQLVFESKNLTDVSKGQELIRDFKNRIHNVKLRIKELKNDAYIQKVAAQNEKDRMGLMLGNNGFMTRQGQLTAAEFKLPTEKNASRDIQVNVTIVK